MEFNGKAASRGRDRDRVDMEGALQVPAWDPKLSVGDSYIDAQHAMLFYLISQLRQALASDEGRKQLAHLVEEVRKYATFHFASEENHMADIGYPDRNVHARIHTRMLGELADHARKVAADWQHGHAALRFVENWLNDHVANEDQKFARFGSSADTSV